VVRAFSGGSAPPKIRCQATKPFVVLVRFVVNNRIGGDRHLGRFLHAIAPARRDIFS
jgi:hypothetical protein